MALLGPDALAVFPTPFWLAFTLSITVALGSSAWAAAQWMSPTGRASLLLPFAGFLVSAFLLLSVGLSGVFAPGLAALCLSVGSVFSLATALVFLFVFRRTAPIFRHRVAVAAGLLSGFTGFLVIQLHCPINELWHMLTGHALLPLLWGLAAYFISRLAFR